MVLSTNIYNNITQKTKGISENRMTLKFETCSEKFKNYQIAFRKF